MAELRPAPFADLVTRLYVEPQAQAALFELPRRSWFLPLPDGPDLSVRMHARTAGNPSGPAAGPHTQMAQNLLLSYVAGGRILELKTVQVDDALTIARPCIDMTNIGYNIEWSQELPIALSLREYVAGAMLIQMFRRCREHTQGLLDGAAGEVVYDISVGYDLAGISSEKVARFLEGMLDASVVVNELRSEIPKRFAPARDDEYPARISGSVTLSTFHGCPAEEIEGICEFLIARYGFDVIVKMNPPTLGRERLEHLLFDVLGYTELTVNPVAYENVISFDDSVALCRRLTSFAAARGRNVGFKFSNTLEVVNHREFFPPDQRIMYLSGQPLHVITLTLVDEFRKAVSPRVPISFSAGVDQHNFASLAACGLIPITASTDLLRPGGYGRLAKYLVALTRDMTRVGASSVDDYILRRFDKQDEAQRLAARDVALDHGRDNCDSTEGSTPDPIALIPARSANRGEKSSLHHAAVRWAGLLNTSVVAELARENPRYRAERNRGVPKRIDSHLQTFDCITCEKCLPVCPNAANFLYPTPIVAFDYHDLLVSPKGGPRLGTARRFEIAEAMQIACFADFCNECGNCDTFCPEYGGPYIKKPAFYGSEESYLRAAPRDGFVVTAGNGLCRIRGRVKGWDYELSINPRSHAHLFTDGVVRALFSEPMNETPNVSVLKPIAAEHRLDMWVYHTLRHLLSGMLDRNRINQVNAARESNP